MHIDPDIFRAYDIRGRVDEQLTPAVLHEIGRAFGSECAAQNQREVVVARDGRLSSPEFSAALIAGLRASGRDVIDIGMVPTPVLYYATHVLGTGTGMMLTASHNPANYNGLKMMLGGSVLFGDQIPALHRRWQAGELHEGAGALRQHRLENDYLDRICNDVHLARPLRIGIDCGNGVAGVLAPKLFRRLGCEVVELHTEVDGNFPNHLPDQSKPENLQDLIAAVHEHKLDIGFAFDGDGDRVGMICNQGKILWPDRQMILFAQDLLARQPGAKVVFDVLCSRHLPLAISAAGGAPDMWKTGHSMIKSRISQTGALLGGEMSGHIVFTERWYGFDCGLYVAARMLEILSRSAQSASALFAALPDAHSTPSISVPMLREGAQHEFMQRFLQDARFDEANVSRVDGLRADFDDGFGLVRASNTSPSLVLRFEADAPHALEQIQQRFRRALLAVDRTLELPF
jgi:phosphomannomutase/phosphoglucomutase